MTGEVRVRSQEEEFSNSDQQCDKQLCILISHSHCSWNARSQQETLHKVYDRSGLSTWEEMSI
eukprot:12553561-Prorocentrum_lima.AAC.1